MSVVPMEVRLVPVTENNVSLLKLLHQFNFNDYYEEREYQEIAADFLVHGTLAYYGSDVAGEIMVQWDKVGGKVILYIVSLSVSQPFRGRKIGTLLLQKEIERAKEAQAVFLHVKKSNVIAQGLYKKLGFSVVGVTENYYGNEDAFVMRKVNEHPKIGKIWEAFEVLGETLDLYTPFSIHGNPNIKIDDLPDPEGFNPFNYSISSDDNADEHEEEKKSTDMKEVPKTNGSFASHDEGESKLFVDYFSDVDENNDEKEEEKYKTENDK